MRTKLGYICMICGAAMVLAALSLFIYNLNDSNRAEESADKALSKLTEYIKENGNTEYSDFYDPAMTEAEFNGYAYVGYLSFPSLGLELPVISECDNAGLKLAPCRYAGSVKTGDLVIAAHNYKRHFGKISQLSEKDEVLFTDMNGLTTEYEVALAENLPPFAVEDMTSGDYELTLFTCTYSGRSRVTIRCRQLRE